MKTLGVAGSLRTDMLHNAGPAVCNYPSVPKARSPPIRHGSHYPPGTAGSSLHTRSGMEQTCGGRSEVGVTGLVVMAIDSR